MYFHYLEFYLSKLQNNLSIVPKLFAKYLLHLRAFHIKGELLNIQMILLLVLLSLSS